MLKALMLVFELCSAEGNCAKIKVPWDGSLMQCVLSAQQYIAQYQSERPGSYVRNGYQCTDVDERDI